MSNRHFYFSSFNRYISQSGKHKPAWILAEEYLDLYDSYPTNFGHAKAHMFKLLHHILQLDENLDFREALCLAGKVQDLRPILSEIKNKYCQLNVNDESLEMDMTTLPVPIFMSQPMFRKDRLAKREENDSPPDDNGACLTRKRPLDVLCEGDQVISNKMKKRLIKQQRLEAKIGSVKPKVPRVALELCVQCKNPRGMTCNYELCRVCCGAKRKNTSLRCDNHSRKIVITKDD